MTSARDSFTNAIYYCFLLFHSLVGICFKKNMAVNINIT